MPLKLIVGLGNPGPEHLMARHNVGFRFIDALAQRFSLSFTSDKKFQSDLCRYQHDKTDCWLCKPLTYMNLSGHAVQAIINYYRISMDQVLIVHDDIDLDVGEVRFKIGGGHGGNNGIRDIIEKTGTRDFIRLRIGVGHPGQSDKVVSHVLSRPDKEDTDSIFNSITRIIDDSEQLFAGEIQKLMSSFNKKTIKRSLQG